MGGEYSNATINYTLLFERVMWEFSVIAQAPAANLDSTGGDSGNSKPSSKEPKNPHSPADRLRHHFEACQNDDARRRVIAEALEEIRSSRYAKKGDLIRGTAEWKKSLRNDTRDVATVAHVHGVDVATVYRWRKKSL